MLAETLAAALICLDPGHGTAPDVGRQLEPIGPGSRQLKIKDGGGAAGEASIALAIARRRGWTDDVYRASARAGRLVQGSLVGATRARDLGVVERADLTGFNWADVPVVLAETGFLTNRIEGARLHSAAYQARVAGALADAAARFVGP